MIFQKIISGINQSQKKGNAGEMRSEVNRQQWKGNNAELKRSGQWRRWYNGRRNAKPRIISTWTFFIGLVTQPGVSHWLRKRGALFLVQRLIPFARKNKKKKNHKRLTLSSPDGLSRQNFVTPLFGHRVIYIIYNLKNLESDSSLFRLYSIILRKERQCSIYSKF